MSTASKCSKCQKETTSTALDAGLCVDCSPALAASPTAALGASPEEDAVKMEIDTDLTTNETMDDIDDQEKSTTEVKEEQQQQQQQAQQIISKAKSEDEQVANKAATSMDVESEAEAKPTPTATPSPRVGKITRSSLNGQRSPTVMKRLRKSTRSTRFKAKLTGRGGNAAAGNAANGHNGQSTGGGATGSMAGNVAGGGGSGKAQNNARSRRTLFKRPAQKTPRMQAATRFVKSVFYKGSYMQIGDIVSIVDSEQKVYYAQIRGLLVDAYCEKSAFLTWLIPTQDSPNPKEGFDPATYLIGPDEQLSRKLCFLEFIMHAPSNYYFDRTTPFPLPDVDDYTTHRTGGFIWTRLPVVKREREREREKEREKERERKAAA